MDEVEFTVLFRSLANEEELLCSKDLVQHINNLPYLIEQAQNYVDIQEQKEPRDSEGDVANSSDNKSEESPSSEIKKQMMPEKPSIKYQDKYSKQSSKKSSKSSDSMTNKVQNLDFQSELPGQQYQKND